MLGSILVLAALRRDFIFSGLLLFSFSLGVSLMFFLVALAGSSILSSSKLKGVYSSRVKKFLAFLLIAVSEYFFFRGGLLR